MLEILYQDDRLVAINKPTGLLVHKTNIARDATEFALQLLRDLLGQRVFPIHRLDRKTSGVLLFGLDSEIVAEMQKLFTTKAIKKEYHAIVRGYFLEDKPLDHELTNDKGKTQQAITLFEAWQNSELPFSIGKFETARYALIKAFPQTGRTHQIRRHLNHLRHPILGDRPHGCSKQNRFFLEQHDLNEMLLHARSLSFKHPISRKELFITAPYFDTFSRIASLLCFDLEA